MHSSLIRTMAGSNTTHLYRRDLPHDEPGHPISFGELGAW